MSTKNRLAIIGRPNVGKSTLFNVITETRRAVVKDQPGVTRDVQVLPAEWSGYEFDVIDTGGITESRDVFSPMIKEKVLEVIQTADALVVVMDGRAGVCVEDWDILRIAHQSGKPFLVAINKVDSPEMEDQVQMEFSQLGEQILTAAFERRWGVDLILDWVIDQFPEETYEEPDRGITFSIVGKPNAGKSSLVNRILGENRMLVSEVAGTTVDAIDSQFERGGKLYTIIDTAGVRRRAKQKDGVEVLASFKSMEAMRRSDLVLLVIDVMVGPAEQDAKFVEAIVNAGKAVIVVANKSDLASKADPEYRRKFREQVENVFHFFSDIPIAFTSAETGAGVEGLFETVDRVWEKLHIRISTRELNNFFFETIRLAPAPVWGTKDVKFFYLVQTNQKPPSFIAFANHPDGVHTAYRRFLAKRIKAQWELEGVPIRIYAMQRGGRRLSETPVAQAHQQMDQAFDQWLESP